MRTFRKMCLSTLVMLAITGIASWHLSFQLLDEQSMQGSLFATLYIFAGLGIIASLILLVSMRDDTSYGTPKFISEISYYAASVWGIYTVLALIIGGMVFDSLAVNDKPFDTVQYLCTCLSFPAAGIVSFLSLFLIHGSPEWTGEDSRELHSVDVGRRTG